MIKIKWYASSVYRLHYRCSGRKMNSQDWMAARPACKNHKKQKASLRFPHEGIWVHLQNEKEYIFMFALHKCSYSIVYGGKTTAISAVYLLKWGVFLIIAYQNAILGRGFVRSVSRPHCAPGVALDAELVTDILCLGFSLHLLLFLAYSKQKPRGKKKPITKPLPRPQMDSQLLFLEDRLKEIPLCHWCCVTRAKAVCLCLRGWGWGDKVKHRRLAFRQTHLDIP